MLRKEKEEKSENRIKHGNKKYDIISLKEDYLRIIATILL